MRARPAALVAVTGLGWGMGFLVALAVPASTNAGPLPAKPAGTPATMSADDIVVDSRGATLVAKGHVAAAYGTLRVTSDALRVDRVAGTATFSGRVALTDPKGRASAQEVTLTVAGGERVTMAVLSGHASVETPSQALLADRIVADRLRDHLEALGNVTLFSQPDLIVTGARLAYDAGQQHAVIYGNAAARATVQNRDGRIRGSWIEVFRQADRAVVHGPIEAEVFDARLTGADATIDLGLGSAVIAGPVKVVRRQGTLLADRVTVFYRARRLVAEGATHMTLGGLDEAFSP